MRPGEVVGGGSFAAIECVDENGLADLDVVAGLKENVANRLVVDERAVGAAEVANAVAVGGADELGVATRHLGVGQADRAGGVAAGGRGVGAERELSPLVGPLDDDQSWHGTSLGPAGGPRPIGYNRGDRPSR